MKVVVRNINRQKSQAEMLAEILTAKWLRRDAEKVKKQYDKQKKLKAQ